MLHVPKQPKIKVDVKYLILTSLGTDKYIVGGIPI